MPLFEYRCGECNKKFTLLIGMTADSPEPACPRCGSAAVNKLVSRFSRIKSEDEALEALEDGLLSADPDDPSSLRKWVREMGKEMADEDGEDFEEIAEEMERELYDGDKSEDSEEID